MGFHILYVHNNSEGRLYWVLIFVALESKKTYSVAFNDDFADTPRNALGMCMPEQQYRVQAWVVSRKRCLNFEKRSLGVLKEKTHRYFIRFKLQCLETRSHVLLFTWECCVIYWRINYLTITDWLHEETSFLRS